MVLELREFLNEHAFTCFFTNFYFMHDGVRLNDYTELEKLNLAEKPEIYMKPDKYDEKSARLHIQRFKNILTVPPVLTA
jgi:hypothetical protein